jgi:hypothetical protein
MKEKLWDRWGTSTEGVEVFNIDSFPTNYHKYVIIDTDNYEINPNSGMSNHLDERLIELIPKMAYGGLVMYIQKTGTYPVSAPLYKVLRHNNVSMCRISSLDGMDPIIERN